MTAALMRGWNQRAQAGLAPARILVVVTILPSSSAAFQQPLKQQTQLFEELRRRLVLNELNPLFATTTAFRLDSLDIIDAAEYPHYFSTSNNNGCSVTSLLQQSRGIQSILLLDDNDTNDDGNAESQPERVLASLMQQIYCAVGNRSAPDFSLVPQASGNDPSATIVINLSLQSIESPTAPSHHRVYDDEMPFSKSIPETMELCSEQTFDKYAASEESSSMQEISIIPIPDTDDHREETLQFEVPTQASTIIANPNEADKQVETMRRLRPQRAFARSGGFARVKNIIKLFPLNRFRQGTKATLDKPSFSIQSNGQPVTITVGNDEHEEILQILHDMLDTLRSHHDENLLDCERIPMDFATYAAPILTMLSSWPTCPQHESKAIQGQLIVFHQQHLGLLRDYYGKMFETMLDHYANDESLQIELKTRVVHNFKVAAERSIPQSQQVKSFVCKTDFNYDDALRGLQEDLNNAMELRKELISDDADTGNSMTRDRRRRFLQYCKMLASKGLMLGVNYLQGWLAWQGIKRSALERERNMPKFPLF